MINCVAMTAANIACPDRSRGHYTYVNHRYPHFNSLGLIDRKVEEGEYVNCRHRHKFIACLDRRGA